MEERAKQVLELSPEESDSIARVVISPRGEGVGPSFYEDFATRGVRVDRVEPGFISCTLRVPPRLANVIDPHRCQLPSRQRTHILSNQDSSGNLAFGAIGGLVDEIGAAAIQIPGQPMNISVDTSIVHISTAKINDELEITSRALGRKGGYSGAVVQLKNKSTGEVVAQGRHSLFNKLVSKL